MSENENCSAWLEALSLPITHLRWQNRFFTDLGPALMEVDIFIGRGLLLAFSEGHACQILVIYVVCFIFCSEFFAKNRIPILFIENIARLLKLNSRCWSSSK